MTSAAGTNAKVSEAAARAQAAMAAATSMAMPEAAESITPPTTVDPVDSTGRPLPLDPAGDVTAGIVATRLAHLRHGAELLSAESMATRGRAHAFRAGLEEAQGRVDESESSVTTVRSHVAQRREVVTQSRAALTVSEQKAATVASEAPGVASKSDEGTSSSGPMAAEAQDLASQASGAQPDDAEAAAKSQQQSGQVNRVSGDVGSINNAISQTGERARGLQAEAAQAQERNARTQSSIVTAEASLASTDTKLDALNAQNNAARSKLSALASGPRELDGGAEELDGQAQTLLTSSRQLEVRLHAAQTGFASELNSIPGPRRRRGRNPQDQLVQRQATPGQREQVTLPEELLGEAERATKRGGTALAGLAERLTGDEPSARERGEAAAAAERRRQEELKAINDEAGGDFSRLGVGQKAGLALRLTFGRLVGDLGSTNWPKFGLTLLRGFVDPRVSLAGIVSGLSMILSGGANLFSLEQWERDPLGNLLKSAADIATGVTIVLGSIAGLAVAIIAICAAIILVTLGFATPVCGPVISICTTVASVVGPWAITAAKIALVLNALVFIKNLVTAATASTADELQGRSEAMAQDVQTMGMMAMAIAGDRLGKAVGPKIGGALEGVQSRLANSGSAAGTRLAQSMGDIGAAMARGEARAARWTGRNIPTSTPGAGSEGASAPAAGAEAPSPAAATPETAPPAAMGEPGPTSTASEVAGPAAMAEPTPTTAPPDVAPRAAAAAPEPAPVTASAPEATSTAAGHVPEPATAPRAATDTAPATGRPEVVPEATPAAGSPRTAESVPAPPASESAAPSPAATEAAPPGRPAETSVAANDNAVPPGTRDTPQPSQASAVDEALPPEWREGRPANDNALPGPEANEQVLAATGTDDVVDVTPKQPKLEVIEGGGGADTASGGVPHERPVSSAAEGPTTAPGPSPGDAVGVSGPSSGRASHPGTAASSPEPVPNPRQVEVLEQFAEAQQTASRADLEADVLQQPGTEAVAKPGGAPQPEHFEVGNFGHEYAEQLIPETQMPRGLTKEVTVEVKGGRIRLDRVDFANGEFFEVKPNTPESIAAGHDQVRIYQHYMNEQHPLGGGRQWRGRVVTYDYATAKRVLLGK